MMLVYRVENENGEGMFRGRFNLLECPTFNYDDDQNHPVPSSKMRGRCEDDPRYIFGFESIEILNTWLYERRWKNWLTLYGYRVSVYEVCRSNVMVGKTQLIFNPTNAKNVSIMDLTEV